jgi:predicted GTPase
VHKSEFKSAPSEVEVPPLILVSNKSENSYVGDILSEIYKIDSHPLHDVDEPIFISAEHGDGLQDLYSAIKQHIPESAIVRQDEIKKK